MAKKNQLTENDIKNVQITATLENGEHLIAVSEDRMLIRCIVAYCKFAKLKDELFAQCSLKELVEL